MKKTLCVIVLTMALFTVHAQNRQVAGETTALDPNGRQVTVVDPTIYRKPKVVAGQKAPEIEAEDTSGKTLKLSEINKGRYVLLDFWSVGFEGRAHADEQEVALYNNYTTKKFKNADKGFTIVSFALDIKKEKWIKGISDNGFVWPFQMADLSSPLWGSSAFKAYDVWLLPQAFLIGPDGVIIGRYTLARDAEEDLKKFVIKSSEVKK